MIKTDQLKDILGHIPLFQGCTDSTLAEISMIVAEIDFEKGEFIYEAGDKADNVYILVNGIVTFIGKTGLGFLNVQRVMERSMIFGWIALVPEHPNRIGSAQCLENAKILSIKGDKLLAILDKDSQSGFLVMKRLCSLIASTFIEKP